MNKIKNRYIKPTIKVKKIKLNYFFSSSRSSFFGDDEIMQVLLAKGGKSKSDYRLKKNIQPYSIVDILAKLQQMNVVLFNWNSKARKYNLNPNEKNIGFIAQEVEALFPELVSRDSHSVKEIDYAKFLSLLVLGIQKLHADNNELKQRLDRLELLLNSKIN